MVPFGFSVGDFIADINLLIDAVHSLSDTNGAHANYEDLGRQLTSLRKGFEYIQGLKLDATQSAQASAVHTALNHCRLCVDGFVKRNKQIQELGSHVRGTLESGSAEEAGAKGSMGAVEESRRSKLPSCNPPTF